MWAKYAIVAAGVVDKLIMEIFNRRGAFPDVGRNEFGEEAILIIFHQVRSKDERRPTVNELANQKYEPFKKNKQR